YLYLSSRRRHTRSKRDWSSDVCSSDLIRSRTHHYPFRLVPPDILTEYLEDLSSKEGINVGAGVFPLVVRAGGGSVRDTLSVLDQLIAGAGENGIEYERAVALLGYTPGSLLDETVDALRS